MSRQSSQSELNRQILEEAAGWVIEFNAGEPESDERAAFNHWIRRSPEHVRAFLEISAAWEDSARLKKSGTPNADALIAEALADDNVVALPGFKLPEPKDWRTFAAYDREPTTPLIKLASSARGPLHHIGRFAAAALVLLFIGGISAWLAVSRNIYSTDTGEQRSLVLTDGSVVELNSRSKLQVHFSATERAVDLLEGQVLFQVSKDVTRPFVVRSDKTLVRAIGTHFDVYRRKAGLTVTVLEGSVAVAQSGAAESVHAAGAPTPESLLLSAGEQVTIASNDTPRAVRADIGSATAWTRRKLIFDDTPLADAVEEFNRYNTRRLFIEDPSLGSLHVRGTFSTTHPERFAQFLKQRFGVTVSETGEQ